MRLRLNVSPLCAIDRLGAIDRPSVIDRLSATEQRDHAAHLGVDTRGSRSRLDWSVTVILEAEGAPIIVGVAESDLDIPRTWVEFDNPDNEDGAVERFRCDLTWLTSNWTCTFGNGCKGIDATKPDLGCCVLGAHFTGKDDEKHVAKVMKKLTRDDWEFFDEGTGERGWVETDEDGDRKTRVHEGACIFLNRPGFGGEDGPGLGCALHQKAWATGVEPWTLKPEVCWQLPIRRSYRTVTRPDGEEYLETTIAEYDRRGWGSGGHDLDWYCSGNSEAHVGAEPVYVSQKPELVELMGASAYEVLAAYCEAHLAAAEALAVTPAGRALLPLYVHPATAAQPR